MAFETGLALASGSFAMGPELTADHVLHLQRTAGNRAVTAVIQRAPGDDEDGSGSGPPVVPQGATTAQGGGSSHAPVPIGATTAQGGGSSYAPVPTGPSTEAGAGGPGPGGPVAGGPAPAGAATGALAQPYASANGGPVPPGFAGNIDLTAYRRQLLVANAIPDHVVDSTFKRTPAAVIRSPHDGWHQDLWNFMRGVGTSSTPPSAFKVGNLIAVAPDHPSTATPLPQYSGDERTGLGAPQVPAETPLDPTAPKPGRPMMNAVAPASGGVPGFGGMPGSVPGPQGAGRQTAVPASTPDILAALKADPSSVKRSPSQEFHDQMFRLDQGKGSTTPTAFRVGNQILVAPDHGIRGVETLAIPGGGAPAGGAPGAPAAGGAPGAPAAGGAAAVPTAAPGSSGRQVKRDVDVTKNAPGVAGALIVEDQTVVGDTTTTKGRGATGSLGGGNLAQVGGQTVTTETKGDSTTAVKNAGSLTLKPDGSLVLGGDRSTDTFSGKDGAGNPIKTGSTQMGANAGLGDKGLTLGGNAGKTGPDGNKHSVNASATADLSGNVSGQAGYQFQTKGGTSLTPSVSGGISVQASDPIPVEGGGFDVTFTVTTSSGASLGAGKQMGGGGASASLQLGSTEADLDTGTKHFDDEIKAKAFRDKAASVLALERLTSKPPTTVEGALQIKIGEERGSGNMSGSNIGGAISFEGASMGYGKTESTTHQFRVRRISETVVQVTGSVSGTKGSDVTGSGGISLAKGSSKTKGFEVTWEMDLGTPLGKQAFELYAKTGIPPTIGATMKSMTSSGSEEDHDDVSIPLLGKARWTGTTWEVARTDDKGEHKQFGGAQLHDQDPSWIGRHILGQDELHSSAQITSRVETDDEGNRQESYDAQIKVSGDSGEYGRETLGEIFMGVPHGGTAQRSGEWTLTASVSPDVVRELAKVNKEMRDAPSRDDEMRVYSKLVKERGIKMVGAQVGLGGDATAWTLELKGDKNFPGQAGRNALDRQRAALRQRLVSEPANARTVAADSQRTLDELTARRKAVAEKKNYTDLPDELRDEQLKLIDKHIADFEFIRHKAAQEAIKAAPGEKIESVRGRLADKQGYKTDQNAAVAAELTRLRDKIADKEGAVHTIDYRINRAITAVQQAQSHTANMRPGNMAFVVDHRASYNMHWAAGVSINDLQSAMAPKADALRMKLLGELSQAESKTTMEALLTQLTDRLSLLEALHTHVVAAAEALKPITSRKGFAGYPKFWSSIRGDEVPGEGDESE